MRQVRHLFHNGKSVMYFFVTKPDLKNVSLRVNKQNEIVATGPDHLDLAKVDQFVSENLNKLLEYIDNRRQSAIIDIDRNNISLQGKEYEIKIIIDPEKRESYEIVGSKIFLHLKTEEHKIRLIKKLLKDIALKVLTKRTKELAQKYGIRYGKVDVK